MPTAAAATPAERFLDSPEFEAALANDDGQAAQEHLAAGRAIYYRDAQHPEGLIRKYPDGRKQLVSISADRKVSVIREI
jgi:hypothetical protein